MHPSVDPEFRALIPPLTEDERRQLEANLLSEGCRDPLVVWEGHNILLDGHHRLEICLRHGIHFATVGRVLDDRNAARLWIIDHQLGRRNLSADQMSYLRGKQYQSQKLDRITNLVQNKAAPPKGHFDPSETTAEHLANQHKVSPKTIKRDAQYAEAVDTLAGNCGYHAGAAILARDAKIAKQDVIALAKAEPEKQRMVMDKVMSGEAKDVKIAQLQVKREAAQAVWQQCPAVEGWLWGDWREHAGNLPDGSISLLLTDPPYGEAYISHRRALLHPSITHDGSPAEAARELKAALTALHPKLTEDAHLLVFCTWKSECTIRAVLEEAGYNLRGVLVWVKNNHGAGDLRGAFAPRYEHIVHAVKGNPVLIRRVDDVFEAAKVSSERHPTEKPVELLRRLMEATTMGGALVADPFGGVASTCVAAKEIGRRYWGCEINEPYYAVGARRLRDEF